MLSNYMKFAWRFLKRNRIVSLINICGLAIGFACTALISLYVLHEVSYDRYHDNADRVHRLVTGREGAAYQGIAKVPGQWGLLARQELPEVENATRFVLFGTTLVGFGEEKNYESNGVFADSSLFEVFSFQLIAGDKHTALKLPNSVVISQSMARRYFADQPAIGQTLMFDTNQPYTVTAVMGDVPQNSHFTFDFAVSMSSYDHELRDNWSWNQYYTYLLLKPNVLSKVIPQKFMESLSNHVEAEQAATYQPFLQPLIDIHLKSNLFREIGSNSDITYLYLFSAVAFLILLIASINFVNLATARATVRAREVGIRKTNGATRAQLIAQFIGEAILTITIAFMCSLVLVEIFLPAFNGLTGRELSMDYFGSSYFMPTFAGIALLVALIAGSYPAFVMSAYRPAETLKGIRSNSGGASLRKALVISQFFITTILLVATGTVYHQLQFIQQKRLGFNPEQLITFRIRSADMRTDFRTFKRELLANPDIIAVSASGNLPGGGDWGIPYRAEGVAVEDQAPMRVLAVDHDFINTLGMEIASGRSFSAKISTDETGAFIINEEAAQQLGWENPLEHRLAMPAIGREFAPVVGVLKDFHFRSMHEKIGPILLFIPPPDWFSVFTVRVKPGNIPATLEFLRETWRQFDPQHPFRYDFFDESFAELHQSEQQIGQMLGYVAGLAIIIACLGLFGLVAFTIGHRTKEIAIRKVLGASAASIVGLLSGEFVKLVILANLLAGPIVWLIMSRWLDNFAYKTDMSPGLFVAVAVVTAVIALATVSKHAINAARTNPVDSLRIGS